MIGEIIVALAEALVSAVQHAFEESIRVKLFASLFGGGVFFIGHLLSDLLVGSVSFKSIGMLVLFSFVLAVIIFVVLTFGDFITFLKNKLRKK